MWCVVRRSLSGTIDTDRRTSARSGIVIRRTLSGTIVNDRPRTARVGILGGAAGACSVAVSGGFRLV